MPRDSRGLASQFYSTVSHGRTNIGTSMRSCEKGCASFHVVLTFRTVSIWPWARWE